LLFKEVFPAVSFEFANATSQPAIHMPPLSELDSSESCEEPKKRKSPNFGNTVEERITYHIEHRTDPNFNNSKRR
tara:strand:- start:3072 stop:3296 length:225 start_codon:yes stop_codon:yes gene_type:complete